MIVDAFTYLGESRHGWQMDREALVRELDAESIAAAVVCPAHPSSHSFAAANETVAAAVAAEPERLVGMARIDPLQRRDAVVELQRAVASLGLRGLFLHPWEDGYPLTCAEVTAVVECAAGLGLPVMVATGYPWVSEASQLAHLCQRHPEVRFVATNGAQINISGLGQIDAEELVARCPNVVLLTNGVYRDDFLSGIVARHGASRVAYGSAYPVMNMRFERRRVTLSSLPEDAKDAVSWRTAAGVFGLGPMSTPA